MPGFSPIAQAPGGPAGGVPPIPDIGQMVQQAIAQSNPQLLQEIQNVYGTEDGIFVQVSDQRYIPILRTILKPVAEQIAGPGAKLEISLKPRKGA